MVHDIVLYVVEGFGVALLGLLLKGALYLVSLSKQRHVALLLGAVARAAHRASLEVHQTYVEAIKKGREDGQLTEGEKAHARKLALEAAKLYLGKKGIAAVMKELGLSSSEFSKLVLGNLEVGIAERKLDEAFLGPKAG